MSATVTRARARGPLLIRPQPPAPVSASVSSPTRNLDLGAAQGTIEVSRARYHRGVLVGDETNYEERIRVPMFTNTPARVRVEGGVTRNMGDYNSIKVGVIIEYPCYPEESEVRRTYRIVSNLVDELIGSELAQASGQPVGPIV